MKKKIIALSLSLFLSSIFISEASARGSKSGSFRIKGFGYKSSSGTVPVRSYSRKNGTFVMPHSRTSPNTTIKDNWSTKPNINPFTGEKGSIDPYSAP